ncbi:acetylornithine transaminase [Cytobacillus sp. IB215665]|uniref:acetylornithine transaminase n=1 Tax=Cytobacillus sp. IB215665 TaxID=3097357 RepID=UPI002A15DBB3|nr:acetylornithine transaminase [Cytobacillus sp. IB215665]MDX8364466.1 acetylornithine transaminase [Cytobacillus sp. IB215665]
MTKETLFPTYQRWDIHVASAEGSHITDEMGKSYLDFVSGIGVCNLGHRHPKVQQALEKQLQSFWHVSNLFHVDSQEEVSRLLVENSNGSAVFFCNSGAEANEAAIKLARKHTNRSRIITFKQSFHGRTFATMTATGQDKVHDGFGPLLEEFLYLPFNDIEAIEKVIDSHVAAVMLEIVQGEGGVVPAKRDFLQRVEELCNEYGALLIVDEVQTGVGRTASKFAYQKFDLSPDIITVAKGLGSGLPIGAMIGTENLINTFGPGSHGSTFGGNPIATAAAKATLEIIFDDVFLQEVEQKAAYLTNKLSDVCKHVNFIEEIRGEGLMIGIACNINVTDIISKVREEGLLVLPAGPHVIRLLPPLTVTYDELNYAINIISKVLSDKAVVAK